MNAKPSQSRTSFNTSGLSLVRGQQKARHEWRAWARLSPLILPEYTREEPVGLIEALQRVLKRQKAPDAYAQALPISDKASHSAAGNQRLSKTSKPSGAVGPAPALRRAPLRILGAGRPRNSDLCGRCLRSTKSRFYFCGFSRLKSNQVAGFAPIFCMGESLHFEGLGACYESFCFCNTRATHRSIAL